MEKGREEEGKRKGGMIEEVWGGGREREGVGNYGISRGGSWDGEIYIEVIQMSKICSPDGGLNR